VSGLHGALKGEQVDGMEASTGGLKMVQEVDGLHLGVKEPGVFEVADVSLFDDVNDELAGSSFSCFVDTIVASNCFVDSFHLARKPSEASAGIFFVIDPRLRGSDKRINVLCLIFGFRVE
jgi:hypothetical protein